MNINYRASIIIPTYNSQKTIEVCLSNITEESKKLESEIIVIDDNSSDQTIEIVKKFKTIKLVKLDTNKGVGNARNVGSRIAKHEILCFIDSDLVITNNSIVNLIKKLNQNSNIGSVSAIQEMINLNTKNWSSNFVCLKSCYGFENIEKETEFSVCTSEFCVITKKTLHQVGGWKPFRNAGGEEFDLGYKINQLNKKNYKIIDASYKTSYVDLYTRFKKIIDRTEKYIHIFFKKKKFDTEGSFATFNQFFSSLLTLIIIVLILFSSILDKSLLIGGILASSIFQIVVEFNFLTFAKKHYGLKMVFFSLYGIHVINLGIILGVVYFIFRKIFFIK